MVKLPLTELIEMDDKHLFFMKKALHQARRSREQDEVPVGAVLVRENSVIGRGRNRMIENHDPSAHAEIVALRQAGKQSKNYRLSGSELYVTLEPCLMCYSAMVQARINRLIYGARDPKTGVFSTGTYAKTQSLYNHHIEVISDVLGEESSKILKDFFRKRRGAGAVERGGLENRCRG